MGNVQDISSPIIFGNCYLKRMSASLGFNSSPSTCELELVPGTGSATDLAYGVSGVLDVSGLDPGKVSGVRIGAFNFAGLVQSWFKNYGTNGLTYTVKLVDPRVLFDNIPVVMGYDVMSTGINFKNVLNCFSYYQTPKNAGITPNGVIFSNVRNYLASGAQIELFDKPFRFQFASGFFDGTGSVNPVGIPPWYTIKANQMSLSQLMGQVAQDMGWDYYAYLDPSGNYGSVATTGHIRFELIKRYQAVNPSELDTFITNSYASGTQINYRRGRELKTDASMVIVNGAPLTTWTSFNTAQNEVVPYWGRSKSGSAVYSSDRGGDHNSLSNEWGIVLLEHIYGSGVDDTLNLTSSVNRPGFRIKFTDTTITRNFTVNTYPPSISISSSDVTTTGYYASENMLRAALYNQDAWESIFYKEDPVAAEQLGITESPFRTKSEIVSSQADILSAVRLYKINPNGRGNRDSFENALIGAVYQAFRTAAENFYGRQWYCVSNSAAQTVYPQYSNSWAASANSIGTREYPELEYEPVAAAWADAGYPSGIGTNHQLLLSYRGSSFKDEKGRLKAFVSWTGYNDNSTNTYFKHPIDISLIPPTEMFVEQGNKLCLPVQYEVYEKKPCDFIVTIPYQLQAAIGNTLTNPTDNLKNPDQQSYKDFLFAMGYNQTEINRYNLLKNLGENIEFGLAPARPYLVDCTAQNNGFFIPVQWKNRNFGPWSASGTKLAGINLINDNDLEPCNFGDVDELNIVGPQTAAKAISIANVIDSADITEAGLPVYNLGQAIGDNSNVTSISLQWGTEGLTTSYSLRTFALPAIRLSKSFEDRIIRAQNIAIYAQRELVDLNKILSRVSDDTGQINKASEIKDAVNMSTDRRDKNKNQGAGSDYGYIISTVPAFDASGNFIG
jgi:hypothetical protein